MNKNVKSDYINSLNDFEQIIKPFILQEIPQFRKIKETKEIELDRDLCIDYEIETQKGNRYYLGSKLQWAKKSYDSFSLRSSRPSGNKTELEKLMTAYEDDTIRPTFLIHSYVNSVNFNIMGCSIIRTDILLEYMKNNKDKVIKRVNKDLTEFVFINWQDLIQDNIKFRILKI